MHFILSRIEIEFSYEQYSSHIAVCIMLCILQLVDSMFHCHFGALLVVITVTGKN